MPSHDTDYMSPRIQSGARFHALIVHGQELLGQIDLLRQQLITHRQQVLDNANGIYQNPEDADAVTNKLVELRTQIQAYANSL